MTAIVYVHNRQVLRAYQALYKKLKNAGIFLHVQSKKYHQKGADIRKTKKKEKQFRIKIIKAMKRNSEENT